MKPTKWITGLSLVLAVIFSSLLLGQEMPKEMKMMHSKPVEKGFGPECPHMKWMGLELTEEQQKKIDALKTNLHKALLPLNADLKVKKAELEKLRIAENPSTTAIDKKIEEIGALRTQIHKALVHHRLQVREILTPEQRIKFNQMSYPERKMEKRVKILRKGMHPLPPHHMEELGPEEPLEE